MLNNVYYFFPGAEYTVRELTVSSIDQMTVVDTTAVYSSLSSLVDIQPSHKVDLCW